MKIGSFDLRSLRQRDLAIAVIVLTLAAAALWFFYLYRPTQDRIADQEITISDLEVQVANGRRARENLPDLLAQRDLAERQYQAFLTQLPSEDEVADLIDQVRLGASDADVVLASIGRGRATDPGIPDVRSIGVELSTSGSYAENVAFLQILEDLRRFTKIQSVALNSTSEGLDVADPELTAQFGLTVFVFTGEDPVAEGR